MIAQHLPILQVIVPLMAAPVCLFLRRGILSWGWATLTTWCAFAISLALLSGVLDNGTIIYEIGDWAAPWGIEYRVDLISAFILTIVTAIGSITVPYMARSVAKEIPEERRYLFYLMYLLCLAGLLGIAITGDAFNLFVFLEISSLSSYVLISLGKDRRALTASFRYLIMGTLGATFYIIGVGLMYMMTGTLNMVDLATLLPTVADTRTILAALAFLTVGLCLKLALFPLHLWLPNAYTYAPSAVTVFLASTATKVAIYALIRVYFTIFGQVELSDASAIQLLWTVLALSGMFIGSIVAIYQANIKRMLAYSSVAQVGYIVLGLSFTSVTGVAAGIVHVFNHALMKGSLFMAMGCIFYCIGSSNIKDMAGLGKRMPLTIAAFVGGGLSIIGVPLTVGFVSKWYLIQAALDEGVWFIAVLVVASSLLAVVYVWRVVEVAYFSPVTPGTDMTVREAPLSMLVPMWILVAASVYFGIDGTTTMDIALDAADFLLEGGL